MAQDKLKSDTLPNVHGVWIHAKNQDDSQRISLTDPTCESISSFLSSTTDSDLSDLISKWESKPLRSKHSFTANLADESQWALYVLHASSEDKAVFLVEDDTPFTNGLELKDEPLNSLLILPFLDGALVRFLERSQVYGVEMEDAVKPR